MDILALIREYDLLTGIGLFAVYQTVRRLMFSDKGEENGYLKRIADGVDKHNNTAQARHEDTMAGLRETHSKLDKMVAYSAGREAGQRHSVGP